MMISILKAYFRLNINRIVFCKASLFKILRLIELNVWRLFHLIVNFFWFRSRPQHIVVCGIDEKAVLECYEFLKKCSFVKKNNFFGNVFANDTFKVLSCSLITCHPLDIFEINAIKNGVNRFRDIKFIVVIKSPINILTYVDRQFPAHYYHSWDFSYYVEPFPSFTKPGVGKAFAEIGKIESDNSLKSLIIRYEDLVSDSVSVEIQLDKYINGNMSEELNDFESPEITQNSIGSKFKSLRLVDYFSDNNMLANNLGGRFTLQYKLFPGIKNVIEKYGYSLEGFLFQDVEIEEGTVVGMYTPDETYFTEAVRMQASMDELGIKHSIDEIPPVEELAGIDNPEDYPKWFLQKLGRYYKARWLGEKRKQIRGPILYCDVDAFFHKNPWPYLTMYDGDIAVYTRREDGKVNSGTIWINDNLEAEQILNIWESKCENKRMEVIRAWPKVRPSTSDQPLLQEIVENNYISKKYKIQHLPLTMIRIFDRHHQVEDEMYIEHLQASRDAKRSKTKENDLKYGSNRDFRIKQLEGKLKND